MGAWVHRLTDIDPERRTATCAACGPVSIYKGGAGVWRCGKHHMQRNAEYRRRDRQRRRAHVYVDNHVRRGTMTPEPCLFCDTTEDVHAHHHDYDLMDQVTWLCRDHHKLIHRG